MIALSFSFPARRYHATPWGSHVNEAEVAWPPEPWRILRALIATYWLKGAYLRWPKEAAARLIDALAAAPPIYRLPEGAVHAHTRHYMPAPSKKTLVFDAFAHLPDGSSIVVAWPNLVLNSEQFKIVADLAAGIGYLGRAESWTECAAMEEWDPAQANCVPMNAEGAAGEVVAALAPLTAADYATRRERLLAQADADERAAADAAGKRPPTKRTLSRKREKMIGGTLPERLLDALTVETADYRKYGWNKPPAAREIRYLRPPLAPHLRRAPSRRGRLADRSRHTVARYLLAGRPQPRIEDALKLGELMRLAALSQFDWETDPRTGRRRPLAPPEVSGRGTDNAPLQDAHHSHAFWLPEDADGDGLIDHVCVYLAAGFDTRVRAALDRLTRLWVRNGSEEGGRREWRLALEGFGSCDDFDAASALLRRARVWRSVTPFLAAAHLKRTRDASHSRSMLDKGQVVAGPLAEATGYPREVRRLTQRRGVIAASRADLIQVDLLPWVEIHNARRLPLQFHRFRSRGRESMTDSHGALLRIAFPEPVSGPVALGYGCHFGLGLFSVADTETRET